jgi:hypothetical protein
VYVEQPNISSSRPSFSELISSWIENSLSTSVILNFFLI